MLISMEEMPFIIDYLFVQMKAAGHILLFKLKLKDLRRKMKEGFLVI
jgi:hypothetical protein